MNDNKNTPPTNFIRNIIDKNLAADLYATKTWAGQPGPSKTHKDASIDEAKIRTRFPPEPNGYLHFGHAKSIILNFSLAQDYAMDDVICVLMTPILKKKVMNTSKVLLKAFIGLVIHFKMNMKITFTMLATTLNLCTKQQKVLIQADCAYVDRQTADEIRINRGTLTEPGKNSPYRDQSIDENLQLI